MRRKSMDPDVRQAVIDRDGGRCVRCGSTFGLACHHRLYRSRGGRDDLVNLVTLCLICHPEVHATNEAPYVVSGSITKDGLYVGDDPDFLAAYGDGRRDAA